MRIVEKIGSLSREKRRTAIVALLGVLGLIMIALSSIVPEKNKSDESVKYDPGNISDAESYCCEVQERLENFLSCIDGAGKVRVYLTVGTNERFVYASECRRSLSENKTEEENKYVMIGSGNEKNALVETIEAPEVTGAVIACTGCGNASVREQIYKAVSAALCIPTSKIYVTKLKGE